MLNALAVGFAYFQLTGEPRLMATCKEFCVCEWEDNEFSVGLMLDKRPASIKIETANISRGVDISRTPYELE